MDKKQTHTKDEILAQCMDKINSKDLDPKEFNKLRQYKARYNNGKLGEGAIKTIFERFNVVEQCVYFFEDESE